MMDNYEQRKVARFDGENGLCIDTAAVTDSRQPYETGIQHPNYKSGGWVIVEMYDFKEEAQKGHDKWVKTMTAETLPKTLKDVSSCDLVELGRAIGGDDWEDEYGYNDD